MCDTDAIGSVAFNPTDSSLLSVSGSRHFPSEPTDAPRITNTDSDSSDSSSDDSDADSEGEGEVLFPRCVTGLPDYPSHVVCVLWWRNRLGLTTKSWS